ncbi:MAG: hypothetical protein J6S81_02060, partial [Treponema sp.]|nr:hypothetical protein [Treponema sp.]
MAGRLWLGRRLCQFFLSWRRRFPCLRYKRNKGKTTLTSGVASGVRQWSLESPALYCLRTALLDSAGNEVDSKTVRFGFREIRFDS